MEGTALGTGRAKGGHEGPGKGQHGLSHDSSKEAVDGIARRNSKDTTYMQQVLCFGMQLEGSEISSFTDREDTGVLHRVEESRGNSERCRGRGQRRIEEIQFCISVSVFLSMRGLRDIQEEVTRENWTCAPEA